jgi:hypothetical protein
VPEVEVSRIEWAAGSPLYGAASIHEGHETVWLKVLSDRRQEGGGIAYLMRFLPPSGKIIRIVATARSDEHIFGLEGGRGTKSGEQLRFPGTYGLNPRGKRHSAFIGTETIGLVVYTGEPDEILSFEILDREAAR